jgi:hypothetical protein
MIMHARDLPFKRMPCCGREAGAGNSTALLGANPMIMGLENAASRDRLKLKQGCRLEIWDAYDFTG